MDPEKCEASVNLKDSGSWRSTNSEECRRALPNEARKIIMGSRKPAVFFEGFERDAKSIVSEVSKLRVANFSRGLS